MDNNNTTENTKLTNATGLFPYLINNAGKIAQNAYNTTIKPVINAEKTLYSLTKPIGQATNYLTKLLYNPSTDNSAPITTEQLSSPTISTSDISNTKTTPTVSSNSFTTTNTNNSSYVKSASSNLSSQIDNTSKSSTSLFEDYLSKLNELTPVDEAKIRESVSTQAGLSEKKATVDSLQAKIDANTASAEEAKRTLESYSSGKDVTSTFLGAQQQEIDRQLSIKNTPLTAQYKVALGDYEGAKDTVDNYVKSEVDYQTAIYDRNKELIDKAYEYATNQEKLELDKIKEANDTYFKEQTLLNTQKNNLISAMKDVGDYSQLSNVINATSSSDLNNISIDTTGANSGSQMYAQQIRQGKITMDDVPTSLKTDVANLLGQKNQLTKYSSDIKSDLSSIKIDKATYNSIRDNIINGSNLIDEINNLNFDTSGLTDEEILQVRQAIYGTLSKYLTSYSND